MITPNPPEAEVVEALRAMLVHCAPHVMDATDDQLAAVTKAHAALLSNYEARSGEIAVDAYDALDIADRLIERAYGADVPDEWNAAYRAVAQARALAAAPTPLLGGLCSDSATAGSGENAVEAWKADLIGDLNRRAASCIELRDKNNNSSDRMRFESMARCYRHAAEMVANAPLPDSPAPLVGDLGASCAESSGGKPTEALRDLEEALGITQAMYDQSRATADWLSARLDTTEAALRYCLEAIDTGRSEPLFIARDAIRSALDESQTPFPVNPDAPVLAEGQRRSSEQDQPALSKKEGA